VKPDEREQVQSAIEAVCDGRGVDWESEKSLHPDLSDTFETLRVLEEIAQVHRDMGLAASREPESAGAGRGEPRKGGASRGAVEMPARPQPSSWGPLQILERVGEGSFGDVYRAFDPALQIQVALKLWKPARDGPESDRQLLDEARRLARVRHPNVLAVHGVDERQGRFGMWTDLIRGHTLEQLLDRDGPFAAREATVIGMDLCAALAALHAAGIVHRDVKTTNVMREQGGRIVLMDFGAVREMAAASKVHAREAAVGTPLAMAPEILRGEPAGTASDLYSLGVLLYRLVSGHFPVEATTLVELAARHARGEIVHLRDRRPDLPKRFVDVVESALSPDPERRPRSAGAFERALAQTLESDVAPGGSATPTAYSAMSLGRNASRLVMNNLPQPLTSFVGRRMELERCVSLLARSRLLTLTGAPGCGKTRLGLRLAESILGDGFDAVWFVDLTPLVERAQVERALASAVGSTEGRDVSPLDAVVESIGTSSYVVVLDNCEHLAAECAAVAAVLLRGCPNLRLVATSREPIGIAGEQVFSVPPMSTPGGGVPATPDEVIRSDAGRLFLECASLVDPSFRLGDRNSADVGEICRRLDGIPLAIELAAALARVLAPREIRDRLDSQIVLRTNAGSPAGARHQTLIAAFEWSYGLLADAERAFLRRLSVFTGRWTLEAATAVCGEGRRDVEVVLLLSRLADKSMVLAEHVDDVRTAYRLLETIRQFAGEKLAESGEAVAVRDLHLDYYLGLAENAEAGLEGPEMGRWLSRLDVERENLLAAVRWALEGAGTPVKGLRLAGALLRYWSTRGEFTIGRAMLERVLRATGPDGHEIARAKALWGAGYLGSHLANPDSVLPWFEESLLLSRRVGDLHGVARALKGLGIVGVDSSDYATARARFEESLAIDRELGDPRGLGRSLYSLGSVAWRQGDYATARAMLEESLAVARGCGATMSVITSLLNLTFVALRQGQPDDARMRLRECLPLVRELGAIHRGAEALELAAETLAVAGNQEPAARLFGAAEALRQQLHAPADESWRPAVERAMAGLSMTMGGSVLEAARAEGRGLGLETALALALEELGAG
jgi:non-specific serine/threonine protein kinase